MFDVASFVTGFFFATILGVIAQQIRQLRGAIGAPRRPFDTFPDAGQPRLTASGVVTSARLARVLRFFYQIIFVTVFVAGIWFVASWISGAGMSVLEQTVCF